MPFLLQTSILIICLLHPRVPDAGRASEVGERGFDRRRMEEWDVVLRSPALPLFPSRRDGHDRLDCERDRRCTGDEERVTSEHPLRPRAAGSSLGQDARSGRSPRGHQGLWVTLQASALPAKPPVRGAARAIHKGLSLWVRPAPRFLHSLRSGLGGSELAGETLDAE